MILTLHPKIECRILILVLVDMTTITIIKSLHDMRYLLKKSKQKHVVILLNMIDPLYDITRIAEGLKRGVAFSPTKGNNNERSISLFVVICPKP